MTGLSTDSAVTRQIMITRDDGGCGQLATDYRHRKASSQQGTQLGFSRCGALHPIRVSLIGTPFVGIETGSPFTSKL